MPANSSRCLWVAPLLAGLAACGGNSPGPIESPPVTAAPPATKHACDLVTKDEMAKILGAPVEPTPDEGVQRTACTWAPATGGSPTAELKIEWGSAEAAMQAASMLSKHEPGINNPYDDLGDEAVVTGPVVMIKRGEDLVTIMTYGAPDASLATHAIYNAAAGRL